MALYEFTAQALTPIFIGCGTEIDPTQFYLEEDGQNKKLIQFNPNVVINRLSPDEIKRFMEISKRNDLNEIRLFLENAARRYELDTTEKLKINEVNVSNEFAEEFRRKASYPDNTFRIEMMPRNPYTGKVFIPGSSIKGALRTALINYFANYDSETHNKLKTELKSRELNQPYRKLEEVTLNRSASETEKDPFRFIRVEDAELPVGATQIDRASNYNPKNPSSKGIKIWIERLRSRADGISTVPKFKIRIHINEELMNHEYIKKILGRSIDFGTIVSACNQFYWNRFKDEEKRFYSKQIKKELNDFLHNLFKVKADTIINPDNPKWCDTERGKYRILLRVGRYNHFESLSVDNFRENFDYRSKKAIKEGSSRTVCKLENCDPGVPFGWLILTYEKNKTQN